MNPSVNVDASAANTISWLSAPNTTFSVPVYQRQYRWTTDSCLRLLDDIRSIAAKHDRETHFIGSILSSRVTGENASEVILIDGQQRITTLVLLIAALREAARESDPPLAGRLAKILMHPTAPNTTRLRPHSHRADAFTGIVLNRTLSRSQLDASTFDENYETFLTSVRQDNDALAVWRGLQKLEHVDIELTRHANPQQVFESINSTGTPLKNHELIHNFVLMGLPAHEQEEVENSYWVPIEHNTGVAIDDFFRDFLVHANGRDADVVGEYGVYTVFKQRFAALAGNARLDEYADWKLYSEIYGRLLDPTLETVPEVKRQILYVNVFGRAMYPLLLRVFRDCRLGEIAEPMLIHIMEKLQALFLRKMIVGESRDHLIAQLCRRRNGGTTASLIRDIERKTPSDGRVRNALKFNKVPHVGYVLRRLEGEGFQIDEELEIEHIFPATQTSTWSGDGTREWGAYLDDEQSRYREVLHTLGNLTLLEQPLNAQASNRSFIDKKPSYRHSMVPSTRALAQLPSWDSSAIEARTEELTTRFLQIWSVPAVDSVTSEDGMTPILDVAKRPGYYKGWRAEFEYIEFKGEIVEVHSTKELYKWLFTRLWETNGDHLAAMVGTKDSPVWESKQWSSQWDRLGDTHYLFMGLFPQYMLAAVQRVVDELNIADELLVKLSPVEDQIPGV